MALSIYLTSHRRLMSWGILTSLPIPIVQTKRQGWEDCIKTAEYEYFNYQYDLLDDLDEINKHACYLTQNTILKDSTEA